MRKLFFLVLICMFGAANAAIYKWVDNGGRVHYSDQPTNNAEKIELSPTTIYSPAGTGTGAGPAREEAKPSDNYSSFVILAPANRETLVNSGDLLVQFQATPGLHKGHYIQVVLDGRVLDRHYTSLDITLEELDRGSHMLHASIHNKTGGLLERSNIVQFFVRRETLLDDDDDVGINPPPPTDLPGDGDKFQVTNPPGDKFQTTNPAGGKFQTTTPSGDKFLAPK